VIRRDLALEERILSMIDARAPGSIYPSEVASADAEAHGEERWRPLMERTRSAGRRLAARGLFEMTHGDRRVDAATASGLIRYRRPTGR
jgi:hypothetical protein